jgi:hypothetical protein
MPVPNRWVLVASSAALLACAGDLTLPQDGSGGGPPPDPGATLTAAADRFSAAEDRTLSIAAPGVLANDLVDGVGRAELEAALVDAPAHGRLELRADGSLDYVPDADWFGSDRFTYRATLGDSASAPAEVVIDVQSVNDAPDFVPGPDQEVDGEVGEQRIERWAAAVSPGPANESGQQVSFQVEVLSGEKVLEGAPEISPSGTLTFRPAHHHGTATVQVRARDDGGTANGGLDSGAPHVLTITINH